MSYYMGINLGHQRSVAIVKDGKIVVAIEQERLDRLKYSVGFMLQAPGDASKIQIPLESINYCLNHCGITLTDLTGITPNMPGYDFAPDIVKCAFPKEIADLVVPIPSHHLAHAYSAFWPSGFEEALVLVVDATGTTNSEHETESYTLYKGRGQTLNVLHSETVASHLATLSTLGFLYEYIARKAGFITKMDNFDVISHTYAEAGKLMGLAPFGSEQIHFHRWIRPVENSYSLAISAYDIFLEVAALEKRYDTGVGKHYLRPYLVDLAYKVQQELEQALLHLVSLAIQQTGLRKLCIAGGVGFNSVINYKLLQHLALDDIFIFPASGDCGIAAGCAFWAYHTIGGGLHRSKLKQVQGHSYSQKQISQALRSFESLIDVEELTTEETIARSAQKLAQGHIVARFEGGSEYGPRALGQRSIIVDPTFQKIKDILNARVKFREAFRPFAPVIPLENLREVFELEVAVPFMLLVAPIKPEYREQIPAVTHIDGTGRVQTVTKEDNPYFYHLCQALAQLRSGPPVLLNTSFNVAGQPIVETPTEAIQTFLKTDIDYLVIENFWISKCHVRLLSYEEHLNKLVDTPIPSGLPPAEPAVTDLMAQLDRALFWGETGGCIWSQEELQALSQKGARYKETSILFPEAPFPTRSKLSTHIVLLLDPLNKSTLVDLTDQVPPSTYTFEEVKLLMMVLEGASNWQKAKRIELCLTHAEFEQRLAWAYQQLCRYNLKPKQESLNSLSLDSALPVGIVEQTLAPFADKNFSAYQILGELRQCLQYNGYREQNINALLDIFSQQQIEPTYFHYYDQHKLPHTVLGDLIRLFLLRSSLSPSRLQEIFNEKLFSTLVTLGVLIRQESGNNWLSRLDLFCVQGLYLATDHRYMVLKEDKVEEESVMYVGADSVGLAYTAPQLPVNRVLDLCCGCGIQGLVASRYAHEVMAVDTNLRAIRFARFNAQLNGIRNIHYFQGNLYEPVQGYSFNTILANPPFVASPNHEFLFRDGGTNGEEVLRKIIEESADYLMPEGKLFIVSDLVNLSAYQAKLKQWWRGKASHQLVLETADRNDILFSIPHCHIPFEQAFEQYNLELEQWLQNFQTAGITTINFGYILIYCLSSHTQGSYYTRTIHNPTHPIHQQVQNYFQQRELLESTDSGQLFLLISDDISCRIEENLLGDSRKMELFSPDNPYFTTYQIDEQVYHLLQDICRLQPQLSLFVTPTNQALVFDLIYKGILYLSSKCPYKKMNYQSKATILPTERSIIELKTLTTPTCLSSYLT